MLPYFPQVWLVLYTVQEKQIKSSKLSICHLSVSPSEYGWKTAKEDASIWFSDRQGNHSHLGNTESQKAKLIPKAQRTKNESHHFWIQWPSCPTLSYNKPSAGNVCQVGSKAPHDHCWVYRYLTSKRKAFSAYERSIILNISHLFFLYKNAQLTQISFIMKTSYCVT